MATIQEIEALLAALKAQEGAESSEVETSPIVQASQFVSLGFVVTGKGERPTEGDIAHVPTKAGKTARVRLIDHVDTTPYQGEFGDWAMTYKRLRKTDA